MSIVNLVWSLEACNTKSLKRTMSARKIRDYNNCCFGMDQYWICEKKILLFVSYSIGILKLMSGNNSSHPDYRTSEMFLSLYFLVPADWLCFQTFALLRVGGKSFLPSFPSPALSLLPQLAEQSGWEQQHIPRLSDLSVSAILQGLLRTVMPVPCLCSGKWDLCNYSCWLKTVCSYQY